MGTCQLIFENIFNMVFCSSVVPIWREPLPGWTDNINGVTGLVVGAGKGVIRSMYCSNDYYADYVPADIVANATIITTWDFIEKR